jgi:hypothetical protein
LVTVGGSGLGGADVLGLVGVGGLGGRLVCWVTGGGTLPFLATLFVDCAPERGVLGMYLLAM